MNLKNSFENEILWRKDEFLFKYLCNETLINFQIMRPFMGSFLYEKLSVEIYNGAWGSRVVVCLMGNFVDSPNSL